MATAPDPPGVPSGLFVTGTDTGVGKTVVTAAIVAALRARGRAVAAVKPVVSGLDEDPGAWPHDHEVLATVAGSEPEQVSPFRFGPAVSPHLASESEQRPLDPDAIVAAVRDASAGADVVVVEGVGGLLVPLARGFGVRDLARELGLPLVVAARPGLGTINHTLLTLEGVRNAGLHVLGVVLTPWPAEPSDVERSNAETIADLGRVSVSTLPELPGPDVDALAVAGADLPLDEWLAPG